MQFDPEDGASIPTILKPDLEAANKGGIPEFKNAELDEKARMRHLEDVVRDMLIKSRRDETPEDLMGHDVTKNQTLVDFLEREVMTGLAEIGIEGINQDTKKEVPQMKKAKLLRPNLWHPNRYQRPRLTEDPNSEIQHEYETAWESIKSKYAKGGFTDEGMKVQIKALYDAYWKGKEVFVNSPFVPKQNSKDNKQGQTSPVLKPVLNPTS